MEIIPEATITIYVLVQVIKGIVISAVLGWVVGIITIYL